MAATANGLKSAKERMVDSTPYMLNLLHLVGPGGAGKTSVGPLLGAKLGWDFIDLDLEFMRQEGEISEFISRHGYDGYARRNVATYLSLRSRIPSSAVIALSSGFLTYGIGIVSSYRSVLQDVKSGALTSLLLPSFELEPCVETIVRRQLARPYLAGNRAREEQRIRERFPIFAALACARFRSDVAPAQLASDIATFALAAMSSTSAPPRSG